MNKSETALKRLQGAGITVAFVLWGLFPALSYASNSEKEPRDRTEAPPQAAENPHTWRFGGTLRTRVESWNWFDPGTPAAGRDHRYTFWGSLLRMTAARSAGNADVFAEIAVPLLVGLPEDAVAPAPQGQLGMGAAYRAANGDRVTFLSLRQAHVTFKGLLRGKSTLRIGRFEFIEGMESTAQEPTLDWLKRERVAHRLIGNFAFTHMQRSADGLHFAWNDKGANVTIVAGLPTSGVFDLNANRQISDIQFAYAAATKTGESKRYDARIFYAFYRDDRGLLKVDSRPLTLRAPDVSSIRISTAGGHYARKIGEADLLAWGAWQGGHWGVQSHRAWAWVAEAGYQPRNVPWRPWFRLGTNRGSGDGNPTDGKHETFFQMLPTPRIYARFPFYNMMNLEDDFLGVLLRPNTRLTLRADYRWLRLSRDEDLWYSGGGAFQSSTFGFAGRPSGGTRSLANQAEASLDYRFTEKTSFGFYSGYARGGGVTRSIYPSGKNAGFAYWELSHRF